MVDAGGPVNVRKCHGVALTDLNDMESFDRAGREECFYAFQLSEGCTNEKN